MAVISFSMPLSFSLYFPLFSPLPLHSLSLFVCVLYLSSSQRVYRINYGMTVSKECERKVSETFYLWGSALTIALLQGNLHCNPCVCSTFGRRRSSISMSLIYSFVSKMFGPVNVRLLYVLLLLSWDIHIELSKTHKREKWKEYAVILLLSATHEL